jgi:hypothetical protein
MTRALLFTRPQTATYDSCLDIFVASELSIVSGILIGDL